MRTSLRLCAKFSFVGVKITLMRDIDNYYFQKQEPAKSCLMALREIILNYDARITEAWYYRTPFFCFEGKHFCYIWMYKKKSSQPYLSFLRHDLIEHEALISEEDKRYKKIYFNPELDLPLETIHDILKLAIAACKV